MKWQYTTKHGERSSELIFDPVNPKYADLYKFDLVRCSFIPPKDFRQLCELARYRFNQVCMKSPEKILFKTASPFLTLELPVFFLILLVKQPLKSLPICLPTPLTLMTIKQFVDLLKRGFKNPYLRSPQNRLYFSLFNPSIRILINLLRKKPS